MPEKSTVTRDRAVSRGYVVREFDRRQFPPNASGDVTTFQAEQKKWDIHFTGVAYDNRYPEIWCGFTSFEGDLLWTFDPETKAFESKGFLPLREEHEVKIHRGMRLGPDGMVYFGTGGLVNLRQRPSAKGGRLFRYDPAKDEYEFLGRPIAHDYIQSIAVDYERGLIYGSTYPCARFFVWDMEKRKAVAEAFIDHLPHQVCLDDDGNCWASYSLIPNVKRYPLFQYSPHTGTFTWTDVEPPGELPKENAMIDSFVNGGDGCLYIGGLTGSLMRLDPRTVKIEQITRPAASRGFGALTEPVDGKLYGVAGTGDTTEVLSYDIATGDLVLYGPAIDTERNASIFRPHELVMGPNRCLYCPETDNSERQCYFWEIQLP